ncbi:MAG: Gfo/Idh/MocA family oxidoreductase [Chloroflexi bacterium]|nr:Gfo/Idh/MocA family oxidoreductase [Chloroflexota bacterium]
MKVGVIGCGRISGIYFQNCQALEALEIVACADIDLARAQQAAQEWKVPKGCSSEELLADPEIELVINLTIPAAHGDVALAAIRAGKSVYNEKPLAVTRDAAQRILSEARTRRVRIGCAPDTFLGGGLQTCRQLIDAGGIGEPIGATAFMMSHGPENWHPNPHFFFQPGAGPLFDMGPYYLTALVSLLGPVRRVTGSARASFPERIIGSEPLRGQKIPVNTPTHINGVLDFASGPIATIITSFDVWAAQLPRIEIYGSEATLSVPDPNTFGGPVRIRRAGEREWSELPLSHGYTQNWRGLGPADLATAAHSGRPHRANGDLAYHVLDVMQSILDASAAGHHIEMASTCERPAPLPSSLTEGQLDP